jgi:hypothetical protein
MERHGALSRQEFSSNDDYLKPGSFAQDFSAQAEDAGEGDTEDRRIQNPAFQGYPEVGFPWNYPGRIL